MWSKQNNDPYLSWTNSMVFLVILAAVRKALGQEHVRMHCVETERVDKGRPTEKGRVVETAKNRIFKPELAGASIENIGRTKFYPAEDLLRIMDISRWSEWGSTKSGSS